MAFPNITWTSPGIVRGAGGRFASPGIAVQFTPHRRISKRELFRTRPEAVTKEMERAVFKHAVAVKDKVSVYPGGFAPGGSYRKVAVGEYASDIIGSYSGGERFERSSHFTRFRYERTGTLFANWFIHPRHTMSGYIVSIQNNATDKYGKRYAAFVHGSIQMDYHRDTGWRRIDDPKYLRRKDLELALEDIIDRWIYRL